MHATAARRSKAVDQVLKIEWMKKQEDRDLEIGSVIDRAREIDRFVRSLSDG